MCINDLGLLELVLKKEFQIKHGDDVEYGLRHK